MSEVDGIANAMNNKFRSNDPSRRHASLRSFCGSRRLKPLAPWDIHPDQKAEIARRAQTDGVPISWTVDSLIFYALAHMPPGFEAGGTGPDMGGGPPADGCYLPA